MSILVIAAHPDDEVLGCGATIARLSREGHDIFIAIMGEGITSRFQHREEADLGLLDSLKNRGRKAARILGAKDIFFKDLPDNRFDTVPILEVIKIIEELVNRLRPQIIYTHHGADLNIDHVVLHRAVLTATRPIAGNPVKELYAFEVPSSTEWAFGQFHSGFRPNVFVDINDTLETKLKAIKVYETETRPFPHPRSPETLRATARRWGSVSGLQSAEAFELVRSIK